MVDQPQVVALAEQDVSALAIGVVDQQIEDGYRPKALLLSLGEGEVVAFGVGVDEQLQ